MRRLGQPTRRPTRRCSRKRWPRRKPRIRRNRLRRRFKTMPRQGPTLGMPNLHRPAEPAAPMRPGPVPQPAAHVESAPKARVVAVRSRRKRPGRIPTTSTGATKAMEGRTLGCARPQERPSAAPVSANPRSTSARHPASIWSRSNSTINPPPSASSIAPRRPGGAIRQGDFVSGKTYELVQFHFHKPAEEKVNGRGFRHGRPPGPSGDDGKLPWWPS